jgi:glycosyltransferase involved in cell wall biosynthesis
VEVAIGAPDWDRALRWGDYHFGRALQGALERAGLPASLRLLEGWEGPGSERADAAIQLYGIRPRRLRSSQVSAVWIISHPDDVDGELLSGQDLVLVASEPFAAELHARGVEAIPLHQCTDPRRFGQVSGGPHHRTLFVANSRGVDRMVVGELASADVGLALYGSSWEGTDLPAGVLRGDHVPNELLAAYYAAADIVLNDTWPDMAAHGFISNRLYDAAASGAFVISDAVEGIEDEFDGGVVTFSDGADLRAKVRAFLADPEARAAHAARARAAVLERHTVDHRAAVIVAMLEPLLAARPATIMTTGRPAPTPTAPA